MRLIARLVYLSGRLHLRVWAALLRPLFGSCGRNVRFDPRDTFSHSNIHLGDGVAIGPGACILAGDSEVRLGSRVMLGPGVTVIGGNHNTSFVGSFMADVRHKRPGDDLGVVIEEDVWVGARATIVNGVTIGRGAIVGACALVTKSVPPYAVAVGVPARVLRFRWDVETILQHELALYPPERRLREAILREQQASHAGVGAPQPELAGPSGEPEG